jgi:ABC-type glycerol-3-phosphate transport system permease component
MNNKSSRTGISDIVFRIVSTSFLTFFTLIVLYPLLYILSSSFSSTEAVVSGRVWLFPVEPTLMGYKAVFKNEQILTGFANSIFYTVVGTIINIVMTVMAGYPLSRKDFYGKGAIMVLFTFTMLFSGGMIPSYLLVKNLGMMDTRWAMLIPGAMGVYYVIIARTFFMSTIPDELYEAAQLDGCSDIKFITRVVVPLSSALLAVLVLFYAVGHWSSYFNALLYLRDPDKFPLQIILRNILINNTNNAAMIEDVDSMVRAMGLQELLKYALIVVASVPVLMIYPFVQKYFVKGVMIGALKG